MGKGSSQLEVNKAYQKDYTDRFETFSFRYVPINTLVLGHMPKVGEKEKQ